MSLLDEFRRQLAILPFGGSRALVAVSGGPDSVALLDLLVRSKDVHRLDLIVAHVDHGIQVESGRVADQVRALAHHYHLPIETTQLRLGEGASETVARDERYAWLEATRQRLGAEVIFTAHHADDQVETVLMRVLCGSGPGGLAGMAMCRGSIVRPLLPFRSAELARHLQEAGLTAWSDPANADPRHLRSWIRTELLPAIRTRLPKIDTNLRRLALQAGRDRAAWDAVLEALPGVELRVEQDGISLAAATLTSADASLSQALLIAAARRAGCQLGPARLSRVTALLRAGVSGSTVPLGGAWRAELSFGRLHIVAAQAPYGGTPWQLNGEEGEGIWGHWRFRWRHDPAPARQDRHGLTAWFDPGPLLVRPWLPGERVRPLAGAGRRPVARCLQEARVPRRRRAGWPVLAVNDHVVWVPGVCRSDALVPAEATDALRVDAEYV